MARALWQREEVGISFLLAGTLFVGPSPSIPIEPRLQESQRAWLVLTVPEKRNGRSWSLKAPTPSSPGWSPCSPYLLGFLDDNLSGTSGMEVDDRVSALEQRLQLQEDELAVLKAALADALRRLRACEEQGAALRARGTPKGRAPPRLGTTASGILVEVEGVMGRAGGTTSRSSSSVL